MDSLEEQRLRLKLINRVREEEENRTIEYSAIQSTWLMIGGLLLLLKGTESKGDVALLCFFIFTPLIIHTWRSIFNPVWKRLR